MAKATDRFKETIKAELDRRAEEDPLFAKNLAKQNKDLDGCINYILTQVKKIGAQGYTDDEIFGMAAHYYDEDDLKECDPVECGVVINHKPELTDEEKQELKDQAKKEVLAEERRRLHGKKSKASQNNKKEEQPNLFSS